MHDTFLKRAILFFAELKAGTYPNATTLAALCSCSKNTAQRVIYTMRDRHMAPIEYDTSLKGYYLTDSSYIFHVSHPVSRDELVALIASSYMLSSSGFQCLAGYLTKVWNHLTTSNKSYSDTLAEIRKFMPSTHKAHNQPNDLVSLLHHAASGQMVLLTYLCPWGEHPQSTVCGQVTGIVTVAGLPAAKVETSGGVLHQIDWGHIVSCKPVKESGSSALHPCHCWHPLDLEILYDPEKIPSHNNGNGFLGLENSPKKEIAPKHFNAPITPHLCGSLLSLSPSLVEVRSPELLRRLLQLLMQADERLSEK